MASLLRRSTMTDSRSGFFSCAWARFCCTQLNRVVCGMGLTLTQRKEREKESGGCLCIIYSNLRLAIVVHAIVQDKTITNCSKISSFRCDRIPTRIVRCSLNSLVNADMSIHKCAQCLKTPVALRSFRKKRSSRVNIRLHQKPLWFL